MTAAWGYEYRDAMTVIRVSWGPGITTAAWGYEYRGAAHGEMT